MKEFKATDVECTIRDLRFKEYNLPKPIFFTAAGDDGKSHFFDFKDGQVVPNDIYTKWVREIQEKLVERGVDYTIMDVKLKIGSSCGDYPLIYVTYKDAYTGEEQVTYLGADRDRYGGPKADSNSYFLIQFDHWTFCHRVADWVLKNKYKSNLANSSVITHWNDVETPYVKFNWITYLTNLLGITGKVLIGNGNLFKCTPDIMEIKNEELNAKYIDWEDKEWKGIDLPHALKRYYFPNLTELYAHDGSKFTVHFVQKDYESEREESAYKFYCINNLCDILDGETILHKEKYEIMTKHWEERFRSIIKENANRYELLNYNIGMQKWQDRGSFINTFLTVGVPDIKGLNIDFHGTGKVGDPNIYTYDGESQTWILTMAKTLGVYDDLVKGIRNIITRNMGNNMLEALIDERRPWFYDVMGMESFDLIGFIGDVLKEDA